jgi:phosphatidylglycerol---prolipoprotein diacylglyceryl transferase
MNPLALFLPGYFSIGHLHVPIYGIFAAVGLVAALWLSQRTAPLVGISAEKLWDAGMMAVLAAFIASRALLVFQDPRAFVRYPLLVLSLPSLSYGGIFATGVLVWIWLRFRQLPVLRVLDAWAPCAALLWAVLSVGHFVEGTDAGMPTRLPWGVIVAGDTVLGRTHPVQLYAALIASALCGLLLLCLKSRARAGEIAALALVLSGATSFLLDMLRQPLDTFGRGWLDPSQWIAVAAMIAGAVLWTAAKPLATPSIYKDAHTGHQLVAHVPAKELR